VPYQKKILPLLSFVCCFAPALYSNAGGLEPTKAQEWEISADKLTKLENPSTIIAQGNVVLIKTEKITKQKGISKQNQSWDDLLGLDSSAPATQEMLALSKTLPELSEIQEEKPEGIVLSNVMTKVKADWMAYDLDMGTVKMRGDVFIEIGPDQLFASSGTVNLKQETGTFENATILRQYKDMHLEGRVIEKTGELTYHIEDGWIITCKLQDGETPPWSFKAGDAEITEGGYAYLRHATFRIKDVPIFYTPIMILPAKSSRQTGFLFPLVSVSDRDGLGLEIPFFINLSPSSDITLFPRYMVKRGPMLGAEARYALDYQSKGSVMANVLSDDLSGEDREDLRSGHSKKERYWLRGKVDHEFGNWIARLDFDLLSDRNYLREFDVGMTGLSMSHAYFVEQFGRGLQDRTVDQRSNQLVTQRSWQNGTALKASLRGYDDLAAEKNQSTALWKLPELHYTGLMDIFNTGVNFSWESSYVNYWREQGVMGQRFDLYPRVQASLPFLQEYLESTVRLGLRDTLYALNDNGDERWQDRSSTENRLIASLEAEFGTTLRKDFRGAGQRWSHLLRPFIKYDYITDGKMDRLPQFDWVDGFGDQNRITYGVNNFLYTAGREYGVLRIQQGYDLRSRAGDRPLSPIEVRTTWYPTHSLQLKYNTDWDTYESQFLRHVVEGYYHNSRGDLVSLDYLFYKNLGGGKDTNSLRFSAQVGLLYNFSARYSVEQSLEDSVKVAEKIQLVYHPSCWSVTIGAETTPHNEQITVMFQLANIGTKLGLDL
jgi:LPS-assembly protein